MFQINLMKSNKRSQSFRLGRSESGLERPRSEETRHLLENQGMSDGYTSSSPNQPDMPDNKVRFSTQSREEVSLYGTPKEEMGPVNSSR